jgi:fido (protein-threonine AMPylation protein)
MIQQELNLLLSLNAKLQKMAQSHFRDHPVYCLAKSGQKITFVAPELISICLIKLLEKVEKEKDFLRSLSIFWIGFIAIHPFENANGRTAKEYLRLKLKERELEVVNLNQIDSILLTKNTKDNLQKINHFLDQNIKIKENV